MAEFSRLFFALWPDDQIRRKLVRLSRCIDRESFKPLPPHNLHVTLAFLGNIDKASELLLKHCAGGISVRPFTVTFDCLSYWIKPRVLCLTCSQPVVEELGMLAAALNEEAASIGLMTDLRLYQPHVTLARHARYLPDIPIKPIVWRAESFCLVESRSEPGGVCYRIKQQWPFTG